VANQWQVRVLGPDEGSCGGSSGLVPAGTSATAVRRGMLALPIALLDCCAEGISPLGAAPADVPTRSLARQAARR
jgi:hypothetical protein